MSHATCTQGNRGDSRLLVIKSQIDNLTPGLSFGHNLCFKCPNGSCEPILNIYVPRAFQWYKKIFNPMGCDPLQSFSKYSKIHHDSNSQHGSSLGNVRVHSLTFSYTSGSMKCDSHAPSWFATLQASALVSNPRLGLRHAHSILSWD